MPILTLFLRLLRVRGTRRQSPVLGTIQAILLCVALVKALEYVYRVAAH